MKRQDEARRLFMVYCVKRRADGLYEFCNRNYEAIGPAVKIKNLTQKRILGMSVFQRFSDPGAAVPVQGFWLYDDRTNPTVSAENMNSYLKRLGKLMKLKCVIP